jgi:hypothetical protein
VKIRLLLACSLVLLLVGCGPSLYPYRVMNDDCSCQLYRVTDEKAGVVYSFAGVYSVGDGITTRVTVSIRNNNPDTLDLSLAYVKMASRNIPYRYNNKFLPITISEIPPGEERVITLEGEVEENKVNDPWLAIAGEELVASIEGIRINGKQIAPQIVKFVPHNPKLSS